MSGLTPDCVGVGRSVETEASGSSLTERPEAALPYLLSHHSQPVLTSPAVPTLPSPPALEGLRELSDWE